jgi:site-specific recombinase XerD
MQGDEIRALRRLQREQEASPYVFISERGGPMSAKSFGTLFERLGRRAGMPFTIFPHMLRHACGYALANAGHDTRVAASMAWPSKHSTHGQVHRACARSVQGFLAMMQKWVRSALLRD